MDVRAKFIFSIGLLGLLCLILPGSLRADTVQIGTVQVSSTFCNDNGQPGWCGSAVVTNDTTDQSLVNLAYADNGTPFPDIVAIAPLGSLQVLGWEEYQFRTDNFSLSGNLAGNNFTVGGTQYSAANTNWGTASFADFSNGVLAIDIIATPVNAPEPGTGPLTLFGVGLLGLMMFRRAAYTR